MSDNSFSKEYRLLNAKDFNYLKQGSSRLSDSGVILYFKQGKNQKSRIGISISTKVGKATIRNRYKRLIRETFRFSAIKDAGLDILVVISTSFKGEALPEILTLLFQKIKK